MSFLALGRILFMLYCFVLSVTSLGGGHDSSFLFYFYSLTYYSTCFFVSFVLPVIPLSTDTLLTALRYSIFVSWFCDHRACISLHRRKNRHGHWLCWMSTGRKNGLMRKTQNTHTCACVWAGDGGRQRGLLIGLLVGLLVG